MVSDVQLSSNLDPIAPLQTEETMYVPAAQMTQMAGLAIIHTWAQPSWVVRTGGPIQGLPGEMQRALASVAPGLPFSGFYSMSDLQAKALATQRIEVALLSAMAGLALLLSAVGIFSLVASLIAQKTREIGIRIALGSPIRQAMVHSGSPGVQAAAWGLIIGLILCSGILRALHSVLYGVGAYDWPTMLTVVLLLVVVALLAAAIPTIRVASISPAQTLRDE